MEKRNLSSSEKNIWLVDTVYSDTSVNTLAGSLVVKRKFNIDIAKKTINEFVRQNDALRINIVLDKDEPMQIVMPYEEFDVSVIDMSKATEEEIEKLKNDIVSKKIDIYGDNLFEYTIIDRGQGVGEIFLKVHHIVSDAWSISKMGTDLSIIYENILNNQYNGLERPSYIEYIDEEKQYLTSERYIKDEEFFKEYLKDYTDPVKLKENESNSINAKRYSKKIDNKFLEQINKYCEENKLSIYNVFLSALYIYLYRISEKSDIVIGTPVLNRSNAKFKLMQGMFVSTIPIRLKIEEDMLFMDICKLVASESFNIFKHSKYPYTSLIENYRKQTGNTDKLYDVMFSYQNARATLADDDKYEITWQFSNYIQDSIEIHVIDLNDTNTLTINIDYMTDLFEEIEISYMLRRLIAIIKDGITNNKKVENIEIMDEEEKHKILYEFNDTKRDYPSDKTVIELFEEQVSKTPNNTALVFEDKTLTYEELNNKANAVANELLNRGVKEGDRVAIELDKSFELIIAIIAVLKVGACYVPIEVKYAKVRKTNLYNDSSCKLAIVSSEANNIYQEYICIDKPKNKNEILDVKNKIDADSPVCILYTSGTTGEPKGAIIINRNIVKLVRNADYITFNSDDAILQAASTSFDVSLFEIWGALLNGGTLHIIKKENLLAPNYLKDYLTNKKISILWITSALFNQMIEFEPKMFINLRRLFTGGDVISIKHVNSLLDACPNINLTNCYGPTECTTFTNIFDIKNKYSTRIPLGRTISNTKGYVTDSKLRLLPLYIEGEYILAGESIALGYINKPDLTKEKFLTNIFDNSFICNRMYKSGDIVRMIDGGYIDFVGRRDNQVKIRGYRIELDEIKVAIMSYEDVKDAVAIIDGKSNNKKINAYFTSEKQEDVNKLKQYLLTKIPEYMVPTGIMQLEKLPLNQNGKVDRKNLPDMMATLCYDNSSNTIEQKNIEELLNNVIEKNIAFNLDEDIMNYGIDSLNAISFSMKFNQMFSSNVTVKDIIDGMTINKLVERINQKIETTIQSNNDDSKLLSNNQKSMFTNYIMDTETVNYNIPFEIKFSSDIDVVKLKKSIEEEINSTNAVLKNVRIEEGNITFENVKKKYDVEIIDVSAEEYDIIKEKFVKPFDLLSDTLFRIKIYKTEKNVYVLIDFHHVIIDGISLFKLFNNIAKRYNENTIIDDKNTVEYINHVDFEECKKYFLNEFSGELPVNDFPIDNRRPSQRSFIGDNVILTINSSLTEKINNYSKANKVTLNSIFLMALNIVMSKYVYNEDIILGLTTSGIDNLKNQEAIGMFVKTVPYRTKIDYEQKVNQAITDVQNHLIDSIKYSDYQYNDLIADLKIQRDAARNPLFDVLYTYQGFNMKELKIGNHVGKINRLNTNTSKFDLNIEVLNNVDTIDINTEFCNTIISKNTATNFTKHYINIVKNIVESDEARQLKDIEMILPEEKEKILNSFNNTKTKYPSEKTVTQIFEDNVIKNPDKIAVVFKDKQLTYEELNEKANQVAHSIVKLGVKEGSTIAIMVDKSIEFMIGALGALKANCVYMPMDKNMPDERVKFVLNDSNTKVILTTKEYYRNVSNIDTIFIDINNNKLYNKKNKENLKLPQDSSKAAYIIYTSGSTGTPKGNIIIHKGVTRLVLNTNYLYFSSKDIMMVSGSLTFDTTIFEIWGAMLYGMTLHFIPKEIVVNPNDFRKYILDNKITTALIPTPIFNQLVEFDASMFKNMHQICIGGDSFMAKYSNQVFEKCKKLILTNVYGPAENAVICTANIIDKKYDGNIPIGIVTSNSTCYVVDKTENLCPPRVPGELYVGGDGLGLGYLNREELTKEKFTVPKCLDEKIYKTGDLTSWNTDGTINFKGRIDFQVKIRGQRIEISEIQNKMLEIKEIKEVVILALQNQFGGKYLVAYYTLNKPYEEKLIEEYLKTYLPIYMIPSRFVLLDEMPLNQNGKIDRKVLPVVEEVKTVLKVEPENEEQEKLLNVYRRVLNNKEFYMTDNFFDFGGDSLIAMKLSAEASNEDIPIIYSKIFDYPTPIQMYREIYVKEENDDFQKYIEEYNYSKINKLLKSTKTFLKIQKDGILLTGAAGFLGSHVLSSLLDDTDKIIYCLIRRKDNIEPKVRLKERLHFFFEDKYDNQFDKRIKVLEGDLTFESLFVNNADKKLVTENVGIIINTAAYVKHYGKKEIFDSVNIHGVNNLIKYSIKNKTKLVHISTLSVSGNMLEVGQIEQKRITKNTIYDEKKLFIGQELNNVYAYSKFVAERDILENVINNKLDAIILRVGNLTGRYTDGTFQPNVEENAFVGRIKSFINLRSISESMKDLEMEFTPIDVASKAVTLLAINNNEQYVYHIYNINHAKTSLIIEVLKKYGTNIEIIKDIEQKEKISKLIADRKTNDITGILLDVNSDRDVAYTSNIHIAGINTINELKKLKFEWPKIDNVYIEKYFDYLRKIKFI